MAIRARLSSRPVIGTAVGAIAILAIACSPAGGMSGMRTDLVTSRAPHNAAAASVSPVTEVSKGCAGQNAEVVTATGAPHYVYDLWIGCGGIGFARSTDGGRHFGTPMTAPGSRGASWDPAIAVAPDGTVYIAFMHRANRHQYPVVDASANHGASFPQVSPLLPAKKGNWGDRDFIAVSSAGTVYVTWDYGPSAALVTFICAPNGSCAFKTGDVNTVIQRSTDGGKTWGPIIPVSPNFPRGGGYSAPVLVEPDGQVDLLSWGHFVSPPPSWALHPGHEFFASSANGTTWPRHLTEVGASAGSIALPTWWIDGDLSRDQGGTLYATWDTQTSAGDIGWLSFSTGDGKSWSAPVRVPPDSDKAVHIVEVLGGAAGVAYVAWQTDAPAGGYASYLRPYSPGKGWTGPRVHVSSKFGNPRIWPGDTFGIAPLPGGPATRLALSWGSAVSGNSNSEIYAAVVTFAAAR
jgi:hypothetical protein